jgi:ubiquitin-protein ligase
MPHSLLSVGIERLIDVSPASSIFVRIDDENTFLWKVLITGPEDTPYGGGCERLAPPMIQDR